MPPGASGPTHAAEHVWAEHDGSMRGHPDEPGRNDNGTSARAVRAVRHKRPNGHQGFAGPSTLANEKLRSIPPADTIAFVRSMVGCSKQNGEAAFSLARRLWTETYSRKGMPDYLRTSHPICRPQLSGIFVLKQFIELPNVADTFFPHLIRH
eukprot:SM000001S04542  [mRNA]  locus=s1:812501:818607:+ [translate_table: standard]